MFHKLVRFVSLVAVVATAQTAFATSIFVAGDVSATNWNTATTGVGAVFDGDFSVSSSDASVDSFGTRSFVGLNQDGDMALMVAAYRSQASAVAGTFKMGTLLQINNPYFNSENPPFVNPDFSINTNGTPHIISTRSVINYSDQISVAGDESLNFVQFVFSMKGNASALDQFGNAPSLLYPPNQFSAALNASDSLPSGAELLLATNSFNVTVMTPPMRLQDGIAHLNLALNAISSYEIYDAFFDDVNLSGGAASFDLMNTITISDVFGFDAGGQRVSLSQVMSANGTALPFSSVPPATGAIPEPASWAMMLLGFGGIGAALRRRHFQPGRV